MTDDRAGTAGAGLAAVMRARRTDKVLGDPTAPSIPAGPDRASLDALLAAASTAPMHYPAALSHRGPERGMTSVAPYRARKLDAAGCRALLGWIRRSQIDSGKVADMLAAAAALIQVSWLPEPPAAPLDEGVLFEASQTNMEHIAAASAFIQNLLLLGTEAGWRTYWSSGGALRGPEIFARLAIPKDQILLGAVFLFPQEVGDARVIPGKWRDQRGDVADWSVWAEIRG